MPNGRSLVLDEGGIEDCIVTGRRLNNRQGWTCWLRVEGMMRHSNDAIVFLRPASLGRWKPILAFSCFGVKLGLCVPALRLGLGVGDALAGVTGLESGETTA
jgi:hypothetical protein